ncbi:hypothetical protein AB4Y42_39510 [Paraburkholderia sp. EG286B]|uniref:hypothetical protein n=1 Tax=Paraburkholderia sp. EG286B TaxID=3237011 RepID=UPI0034D2AE43
MPDGSHEVVIANLTRTPDGIKVDAENQVVYWTNMGTGIHLVDSDPASGAVPPNDGTIESAKADGKEHCVLVPSGLAGAPKELALDKEGGHLYWCDREGMRVMRARLDGTEVTELVRTGRFPEHTGDATRHCVGIALDKANGCVYWSQKDRRMPEKAASSGLALSCRLVRQPISARMSNVCWPIYPNRSISISNHRDVSAGVNPTLNDGVMELSR